MNSDAVVLERLTRIEERLTSLSQLLEQRVARLEEEVEVLQKGQHRLMLAVVLAVGAGTPLASLLLKVMV